MGKLTAAGVRNAKPGRHGDGAGLYLLVKPPSERAKQRGETVGAKSWLLRVQVDGTRRDIGLGAVDAGLRRDHQDSPITIPLLQRKILTLAEARDKCDLLRKVALAGGNPVAERDKDRRSVPTFAEATRACHADLKGGWSQRQADSFLSSLERHAFPTLGKHRVDQVEARDIRDMLAPIWHELADMSRKVRGRVATVLNYAHSKGWRDTEAPGKSVVMGLGRKVAGGNYAAMAYSDVPAFVASVRAKPETVGRLALLFTVHTAARSGEVRNARWSHIDLDKRVWNRPASLMKSGAAHTVTLTDAAVRILTRAVELRTGDNGDALVFPSVRGTPLSDMTLSKVLRDAGIEKITVHGFRSSFRDFAAEQMPTIPDAVAEAALAHVVPDKVERAYKRTEFLEMRRKLLDGWAAYLAGASNVVRLEVANG